MNKQGAWIAAIGGHVVDLWHLYSFAHVNPHSYSKFRNIKSVAHRTGAKQMIETGTYLGNTAMRCSFHFDHVYTIELDGQLATQAASYLKPRPNVDVISGDALIELPKILAKPEATDLLVFLDGHFSGGRTALGDQAEPACDEIEILAKYRDKVRAIVIDDFRCFGVNADWPTKAELLNSIERHFNDEYEICVHLDQVLVYSRSAKH